MDSAFEGVYHSVRQDPYSQLSSVAVTVSPHHHWETVEQNSPASLNVAEWQPLSVLKQEGTAPVNGINLAASKRDSSDVQHTPTRAVYSERRLYTLEDLIKIINIQRSLLLEEMDMPQEPFPIGSSVPQKLTVPVVRGSDQSPANGSLNVSLPSLCEGEHEILAQERRDAVDHEEKVIQSAEEHRSVEEDKARDEGVSHGEMLSSRGKDSITCGIQERHEEEEINQIPVEYEKDGDHKASSESDTIITEIHDDEHRKHSRENTGDRLVKCKNLVHEVDKHDRRGGTEVIGEDDSVTVLSEYSFDLSVCKTREHSIESSMGSSSSTSYEGVKIIVNVSELTEKKYLSTSSSEKSDIVSCSRSSQKMRSPNKLGRKICKRKHKPPDRDSRRVRDKATMTTLSELERSDIRVPDVMVGKGETERNKGKGMELDGRRRKSHHVFNRNVVINKNSSEGSTSYKSLPDQLATSHIQDIGKLFVTVHDCQKNRGPDTSDIDPRLAHYISRLLTMSRESIENLGVSTSDISTSDVETSTSNSVRSMELCEMTGNSTREQTEDCIYRGLRSIDDVDAMKELTDIVKGKTKPVTDEVPVQHLEDGKLTHIRQAVCIKSVQHITGPHSYSKFRHSGTQTRSTSTPKMLQISSEITNRELCDKMEGCEGVIEKRPFLQERLHGSHRCDEDLCDCDVKIPPFSSLVADMSCDECKMLKFPEIFSDYSEKCSERISSLTKKIEQIRGEKRRLMETSGSSSSSSTEGQGYDSTKYLSPPESSVVMTQILRKDKVCISPQRVKFRDQDGTDPQEMSQNKASPEGTSFVEPSGKSKTRVQQQHSHSRPPPCMWRHKLQSAVGAQSIKELSTIIEVDSTQSSCCSPPHSTDQVNSVVRDKSADSIRSHEESKVSEDEEIPDIMTEMLKRGLITSPLPWTKMDLMSEDEISVSEGSGSSATSFLQHAEHDKFKQDVLESYVGQGVGTPDSFKDCQSIADKKIEFSQQVAETFAKLGKNPSRTDVKNAFKNLGLKWKAHGRDQSVNPVISKDNLDPASEEFRQQVLESFVGLGLDSSPEDLEAAFRRLGLDCPGGFLCRSDLNELNQT